MIVGNISLGKNVQIDPSTSINNVSIGDGVKIAKNCSIYGSAENQLQIGEYSYVGMNSILNGYACQLTIGKHVSIAQSINIMTDSGPNASEILQRLYPIIKGPVTIGDHSWIGTQTIIMPGVTLGEFCIVAANSFVNCSFPAFTIVGGSPARIIRYFKPEEIEKLRA